MRTLVMWLLALFYALYESAYFGWNMFPKSPEETICDGISVILLALVVMIAGKK
jgi:hypothetical protein